MKNSFIFDFDGTIAETIPVTLKAIEAAYADNGLPVPSDAEIVAHFGANEYGMFLKMTPDHADELFEAYIREFVAVHQKFPQKPFDGIVAAIRKIKDAGWKIGLVTGKHIRAAEKAIEIYGLSGLFDDIRCGGINGSIKTQNISELLDIWAIAPQNTWYIGDVVSDVTDSRTAESTRFPPRGLTLTSRNSQPSKPPSPRKFSPPSKVSTNGSTDFLWIKNNFEFIF